MFSTLKSKAPLSLAFASLLFAPFALALTTNDVWINEFHYDNAGGDTGEFVEVAAQASADLASLELLLYNGSDGEFDDTKATGDADFDGIVDGIRFLVFDYASNGIQNGSPDGLALAYSGGLIQFLSYEGSFTAVDGPANGETSVDIGVEESNGTTPAGHSLQLTGSGSGYGDFTWNDPQAETKGGPNAGQRFQLASSSDESEPPTAVPDTGSSQTLLLIAFSALLAARRRLKAS